MDAKNIRNFPLSPTLTTAKHAMVNRMLEITNTVEKEKMKEQMLDSVELERERGITIKMQPVRMKHGGYVLNLIDTPSILISATKFPGRSRRWRVPFCW